MPFDPDDPRLTAFALGELDATDRDEVEAMLRDDPDARAFVQGVEETARMLADEFRHEAGASDGLGPDRRVAIERRLTSGEAPAAPARAHFRAWPAVAAAAGVAGLAGVLALSATLSARRHRPEFAMAHGVATTAPAPAPAAPRGAEPAAAPLGGPIDARPEPEADAVAIKADPVSPAATGRQARGEEHAVALLRFANPSEPLARAPGEPAHRVPGMVPPLPALVANAPAPLPPPSPDPAAVVMTPPPPAPMGSMAGMGGGMGGIGGGMAGQSRGRASGPAVIRDHALGNRLPVVVGTQGAGVANFTPNLDRPYTQGSAAQIGPFNAVPNGQPSPGQAGQDQANNGQAGANGYRAGVYNYDTSLANGPQYPDLPGQQAGQAPSNQPYGANQAPAKLNAMHEADRAAIVEPALLNRGVAYARDSRDLSGSRQELFAKPDSNGMTGPQGNQGHQAGQPQQPQSQAANSPGQGQQGQGQGQNFGKHSTLAREDPSQAPFPVPPLLGGRQAPAAPEPAQAAAGKPSAVGMLGEKKESLDAGADLENTANKLPAGAMPALAQAKVKQQVELADRAVVEKLADVDREVEQKRAEVRRLSEEAETLRRQRVREQTRVDREAYARFYDHPFLAVVPGNELSTFSIDVDTGSYANVRRFLAQGQLPPPDAVRIEELLNYFRYDDPAPKGDDPFSITTEVAACPWDGNHRLMRVGLKGRTIDADKRPTSNLVFLIDVSGSMSDLNKLPLLKAGMKLLVEQLGENDRVGIVTYSNEVKEAFPSTPCHRKAEILAAIDALQAGGGTNGGAGVQAAYAMAEKNLIKGGTNRVILATDGDFNVGLTKDELLATSEQRAKSGVFLTVLGFGQGNIQEDFMEQLADKGNGHYCYIDTIDEARKTLVRELSGTLVAIARDVKVQVEFNPERVASYRLIGYENRAMAAEDFRNDRKDAGEIGAGHSVTALYEIVPAAPAAPKAAADRPLKYRRPKGDAVEKDANPELLTVFLRYKKPDGDKSEETSRAVVDDGRDFGRASADLKFSAAVAGFGMLLRESPYKGSLTYPAVVEIASASLGADPNGDRKGFVELVRQAERVEANLAPGAAP